jgi:ribose 5-phosphate isomerase A
MTIESKKLAGISAAKLVKSGMVVGLGTGSTTAYTIEEIGRRIEKEGIKVLAVHTSAASEKLAKKKGIPLTSLDKHPVLDIAIDGADQVDARLNLIKGGWGAQTMEKVVAMSAKKFIVVVDGSKAVKKLSMPVPLEVLPSAKKLVEMQIKNLGGKTKLRDYKAESGNLLIDADFGTIEKPDKLDFALSKVVGVVEHGIFPRRMVAEVHVGKKNGVLILKR